MSLFVRTEKDGDALILGVLILGNRASAPVCMVLGLEGHLQPFDLTQPPPSMPNQHSPARLPTSKPPRCQPPHTPPGSLPDFQHLHPSHGDADAHHQGWLFFRVQLEGIPLSLQQLVGRRKRALGNSAAPGCLRFLCSLDERQRPNTATGTNTAW